MSGFTTRAVHGLRRSTPSSASLRVPVYDTAAFEHANARALQQAFAGRAPGHVYSRISNPTVDDLGQRLRLLAGGMAVLPVASGMAAISSTILTLAGANTNLVTSRHLFGNTLSLFERTLKPWGLEIRYVDMTDPGQVEGAIDRQTRAVFLESITNPQLEVADCRQISKVAKAKQVPLLVDNTALTPYLFDARAAGADIELLSTTKYVTGGATSVGGAIIDHGSFDWRCSPNLAPAAERYGRLTLIATLRQEVHRNLGACLSPHNAYLQALGLESMALRIERSCANAQRLAEYLAQHPKVGQVHYPGLASSPYHRVARQQFRGMGGLLTFDLADQDACFACMDALRLIRRASNINDNKSLIIHPASTLFAEFGAGEKERLGIRKTMLRLSAGIEDADDLIDDLEQGLSQL